MKASTIFSTIGVTAMIAAFVAAAAGWVMNIMAIFQTVGDPLTAMFILRCVGVFIAPLGAIVGWL